MIPPIEDTDNGFIVFVKLTISALVLIMVVFNIADNVKVTTRERRRRKKGTTMGFTADLP